MATEVILPKVDMDMATGRISRWFAREGERVEKGAPLFEIETDKAAMEVEAPASGILSDVTGVEDTDIPVGVAVAWIRGEGEAAVVGASAAAGGTEASRPNDTATVAEGALPTEPARAPASTSGAASAVAGIPPAGLPAIADVPATVGRVRATPLARRLARQKGIDLASLRGTGPNGRVQSRDIAATEDGAGAGAPAPARPEQAAVATAPAAAQLAPARSPEQAPAVRTTATVAETAAGPLNAVWMREGTGTPVVLVHGFGADLGGWRPFLSAFGPSVPVLGLDLPGHGGSAKTEANGFDDLVAAAEETLAALGLSAVHLVGHSLGGAVALALAGGATVEARSAFLLAPAGLGPAIDTGFTDGFAAATGEAAIRTWMGRLVEDGAVLTDGLVRATARARADGRLAEAQTRLAPKLFANGTQLFSVRALLGELAVPAKVVVGAADRIIPSLEGRDLPGHVALHRFAGTGHMPHLEQRLAVARLLAELVR